MSDEITKEQIINRIETCIRIHTEEGKEVPKVVTDSTLLTTLGSFLDSVYAENVDVPDLTCNVDYCLYASSTFFSYGELLDSLCDIYCLFYEKNHKDVPFVEKFELSFDCLRGHQEDVWQGYLKYMVEDRIGSFHFASLLFQDVLDITHLNAVEDMLSADMELAILALRSALYYTLNSGKICRFMFELADFIPTEGRVRFLDICINEVYRNYPGSCGSIADEYNLIEESPKSILAQRIIEKREHEHRLQESAHAIPDLFPSLERYHIYRAARQEQNSSLVKDSRKKSVLAQLFQTNTLKYGKRSAFIQEGVNGASGYQVSPFVSIKHEYELPFLYVTSPYDWIQAKVDVLHARSEYIASHC